jgi:hypothetical protein
MTDDKGTVLLDITLTSNRDTGPLQMVSGEQLAKYQAIERVARRLVYNKHIACGTLRPLLDALEVTLVMPADQGE